MSSSQTVAADQGGVDPQQFASALLNVLADFEHEKSLLRDAEKAALNILDDIEADKSHLMDGQRAFLNILEDSDTNATRLGAMQSALLNVLDDVEQEKGQLVSTQRALLNMLEDVDTERLERAEAEAKVRSLNDSLEARVALRTQELSEANQELETFAYSVSHDLRTPLRAIDGFSEMLSRKYAASLDAEAQRLIKVVRDGASKMAQLIDDILAFSRVGRSEMAPSKVQMHNLVQDVLREIKTTITARDIRFVVADLPPSHGDAAMLRRVWQNLLENAVKYTGSSDPAMVWVEGECGPVENTYHVRDNGVGFDMRYVDKLFGVFRRLHGPDEFPGTGIGLAIVKRIVTRHGGRVWAEGVLGQGASFHFALPNGSGE